MKPVRLPVFGCLLAFCILYCGGCSKEQRSVITSFNYGTTDTARGEAFQKALELFLKVNNFAVTAPPGDPMSNAGGHSGSTDIWVKGSYQDSQPFYLRYYADDTPKTSISMHGFAFYGVHGSDSDMQKMTDTINKFSAKLQQLADQYGNFFSKQ